MRVGVISDTHRLLRPEAIVAMRGFDHILHAGDIGDPAILDLLRRLAPLTAIRGNIDRSGRCAQLPATEWIELAGHKLYMLHDINELDPLLIIPSLAHHPVQTNRQSPCHGNLRQCRVTSQNPRS